MTVSGTTTPLHPLDRPIPALSLISFILPEENKSAEHKHIVVGSVKHARFIGVYENIHVPSKAQKRPLESGLFSMGPTPEHDA